MKKILSILIVSISLLITHSASAEGYFGVGGSSISGKDITAGINVGIIAGLKMSDNFGVELDIDTSVVKAKSSGIDIGYQTTAAYGVFRSGSDTYFKAKAGYHSTVISASGSSSTVSALAYGIGMGFGDAYEVEYTVLTPETGSDNLTKLSLTVMF